MATRIWINRARTYKTNLMTLLRENPDGMPVQIHATHVMDGPAMMSADHASPEPDHDTPDEAYAAWALDYVQKHGIDILIPSARVSALARHRGEFARLGTTLLSAPDASRASVADSKCDTYRVAAEAGLRVPLHFPVSSSAGFLDAVQALEARGYTPCVKPDTGFAAQAFWVITRERPSAQALFNHGPRTVHVEDYARMLAGLEERGEKIPQLIVMARMDSPEVSIDCLRPPGGGPITTIARSKARYARIFDTSPLVHHIGRTMADALGIDYLSNIQTRALDGEQVLLEVNARASDGLPQCMATGVNLPWEAVRIALGEPVRPLRPDTTPTLYVVDSVIAA